MPGVAFLVGSGRKLRPVVVHTDSRFRYAALLRYCTDYAREAQKSAAMDGWGRRYAPRTAHKSRFRRALKTQKHNPYSILTAQRSENESPCAPARRGLRPLRCGGNPPKSVAGHTVRCEQ